MSRVIDFPCMRERQEPESPWLIYIGRLSGPEGERVVCGEDNSIMIYTERLDRVPFLVEKGKKLVARKSRRVRRQEGGGNR